MSSLRGLKGRTNLPLVQDGLPQLLNFFFVDFLARFLVVVSLNNFFKNFADHFFYRRSRIYDCPVFRNASFGFMELRDKPGSDLCYARVSNI